MSFKVYIRHAAEQDILAAADWYDQQQADLARQFYQELVATIKRLETTPLIYQTVYRGVRRAVLHRFPYLVWYRVEEQSVTVLACTHARAHPDAALLRLGS